MFDRYGDLRRFPLHAGKINLSPQVGQLWHSLLAGWELEEIAVKLDAGDAVLAVTPEGRATLARLPTDPLALLEDQLAAMEALASDAAPSERTQLKLIWSRAMEPVLRWCHANQYPVEFGQLRLDDELKATYDHFIRWGSGQHTPDPRKCVAVGYPFYHALFSVIRFATYQFPALVDVLKHYAGLREALPRAGTTIDHRFWDQRVLRFGRAYERGEVEVLPTALEIEQHPFWPIVGSQGPLAASVHLLGLAAKELKDVLATVYETGPWFEDVVADELSHMRIPIVSRNVQVPDGEIDLVAFDALHYYVIEEKDYGPRGRHGYFSSEEYVKRLGTLHKYVNRFADRVEWVRRNREQLAIPSNASIRPLLILSTDETDLQVPPGLEVVNVRRLCGLFGGDPVDPLLEYEHLERDDSGQTAKRGSALRSSGGEKRANRRRPRRLRGLSNSQTASIFDLVTGKFGSVVAYQVYRIAWEIDRAREKRAVSVMELTAKPVRLPSFATAQYVRFVAYKADHLSLESIDDAMAQLEALGWIRDVDGKLALDRALQREMYKFKGRHLVPVENEDDGEVFLFVPSEPESDPRLVGLIDVIIHPNKSPAVVLLKEASD